MPAKPVLQYKCERCRRTWHEEVKAEDRKSASIELLFVASDGTLFDCHFEVLCSGCEKTVKNYVDGIAKEMKNSSPQRRDKAKESDSEGAALPSPSG